MFSPSAALSAGSKFTNSPPVTEIFAVPFSLLASKRFSTNSYDLSSSG